jgi:CDGSH-type Zn-finger protein
VTERQIARKAPYPVDVEAGKTYYWCACGQSKKQPFCDGSQQGYRHHARRLDRGTDGPIHFLRLQTFEQRTPLRWQ